MIRDNRIDQTVFALLLGICLTPVLTSADEAESGKIRIPTPTIDLKRLEPQVAEQLANVQQLLLKVASDRSTTAQQKADAYGEFGKLLHAYGSANEAVECYRQSTIHQPADWRWWHFLGCAYEQAGHLKEAEAAFRQAGKQGDYHATRVRLANVLIQLNRRAEARQIFNGLLVADPKLIAAHVGIGTVALEEREFAEAIEHLSQALELAPAANRLHYSLAMAYRGAGDLPRARHHLQLRGEIAVRPNDPLVDELPQLLKGAQVHQMRGKVAFAAGAFADAIREYRLAIEAVPDSVTARVNLAAALIRTHSYDEATRQLQAALKLDPANTAALFNLASLHESRAEYQAAHDRVRQLLEIEPHDVPARQLLAKSLVGLDQPDKAIAVLKETTAMVPDDEATLLQLSQVLIRHEQSKDAYAILNTAATRHPDRGLTAHALARFLVSTSDETLRDGKRALQLATAVHNASPNFEHTETLALALAATERFDEAIRLQKQLLAAAEKQGVATVANRIRENLARFERREMGR